MFKGCWLRLKNNQKRPGFRRKTGLLIAISLAINYFICPQLHASIALSIEKIQLLGQNYQGEVQKRFRAWAQLIEKLKNAPVDEQLVEVNDFFNQFNYQSDLESRNTEDYWKSPDEFIIDGGGDCEDYAIIKYFTLVTLGVPTERLRITYVTNLTLNQAHMVLSYYPAPEAEPLILDSLEAKILKASKRPDLKPVYSFNGSGLWLAKQRGHNSLIGRPGSIDKWDELVKRMQ